MNQIKNWLMPLGIFVVGEIAFLVVILFSSGIDTAQSTLAISTNVTGANVWGWTWLMSNGVVKGIFMFVYQAILLFTVGFAIIITNKRR